jgi:valyl-tRNA synthetase
VYFSQVVKPHFEEEQWFCGRTHAQALQRASEKLKIKPENIELEQDTDVLDTWYSSGEKKMKHSNF